MKKQFSRRHNSLRSAVPAFVWTFGAAFMVLVLLMIVRVFLPGVFIAAASPLWKEGTTLDAGVGSVFARFGNVQAIVQKNAALTEQVLMLQNENEVLTARAQDLTKLLGGQNNTGEQHDVVAGVLARPPESPYDSLIVGVGSDDGVGTKAQVFAAGGIPIGTVQSVTPHSATITLLTTPGRTTSGWAGTSRTPVTLTGTGAGSFTATLPKAAAVSVGDSLYIPGPGAIPVGTVIHVDSDPSSPTVVLDIQPLVNIFSLTWVEIAPSS